MGSSFSKQDKTMRDSASSSRDDACKKEACAIQACLSKKNYNPDACTHQIENLKRCCEGVQGNSIHCAFSTQMPA
ncbi:probable cx9C motif-containing protein 4, mitochondrial [Coccomyxa sp. Obi]|nr:probable cx9C motif-containing protein 4, mitochondrial [Coccomyxa sp. Obi]